MSMNFHSGPENFRFGWTLLMTLLLGATPLFAQSGTKQEAAPEATATEQKPETPTVEQNQVTEETTPAATADAAIEAVRKYIEEQKASGAIKTDGEWRDKLPKFPAVTYTEGKDYFWNLKTNLGDIVLKFMPATAPNHVANYLYLSELKFFDDLKFHRVIPGFMAQGGCPYGRGTGGPGYKFDGEYDPSVRHDKPGILSMANAGPGTDGSQFFITFVVTPHLDGKHTVFGEVVSGMDVVSELEKRGSGSGRTTETLKIESATITVK